MRYALTGATGFLGGALARALLAAGHDVAALVRDPGRAAELAGRGALLVPGDLHDQPALRSLLDGADGFFHVAGWFKLGDAHPEEATRTNVAGTRTALQVALDAGVPRVVYTSTLAVNSDTGGAVVDETYRFSGSYESVYSRTKAQAHEVARQLAAAGAPVVTVMPGLIYGPGDASPTGRIVSQAIRGRRPLAPAGGGVCWGYVDDVVAGHVLAMERGRPGEDYMLAGPRLPLVDGLRRAAALAGVPGPVAVPAAAVRGAAALSAALSRVVPVRGLYAAETLRSSLATYYGSSAKAQAELGWAARPLDEGLPPTMAAARGAR